MAVGVDDVGGFQMFFKIPAPEKVIAQCACGAVMTSLQDAQHHTAKCEVWREVAIGTAIQEGDD